MLKLAGHTNAILDEGMGGRLKTKHGQLVPLRKRLNPHQAAKRQMKITARRTVAEAIITSQNRIAGVLNHFFTRNLLGRLRWVFTGK